MKVIIIDDLIIMRKCVAKQLKTINENFDTNKDLYYFTVDEKKLCLNLFKNNDENKEKEDFRPFNEEEFIENIQHKIQEFPNEKIVVMCDVALNYPIRGAYFLEDYLANKEVSVSIYFNLIMLKLNGSKNLSFFMYSRSEIFRDLMSIELKRLWEKYKKDYGKAAFDKKYCENNYLCTVSSNLNVSKSADECLDEVNESFPLNFTENAIGFLKK